MIAMSLSQNTADLSHFLGLDNMPLIFSPVCAGFTRLLDLVVIIGPTQTQIKDGSCPWHLCHHWSSSQPWAYRQADSFCRSHDAFCIFLPTNSAVVIHALLSIVEYLYQPNQHESIATSFSRIKLKESFQDSTHARTTSRDMRRSNCVR